jgi:tetratricopeptide (TPR) repeat protein
MFRWVFGSLLAVTLATAASPALADEPRNGAIQPSEEAIRHAREAMPEYDARLKEMPDDTFVLLVRCDAHAVLGEIAAAVADCSNLLRLKPNDGWAYNSRGYARLRAGQLDAAIADYDLAHKFEPMMVEPLYGRGMAKRLKGDIAGSNADFSAATTIFPGVVKEMADYGMRP